MTTGPAVEQLADEFWNAFLDARVGPHVLGLERTGTSGLLRFSGVPWQLAPEGLRFVPDSASGFTPQTCGEGPGAKAAW